MILVTLTIIGLFITYTAALIYADHRLQQLAIYIEDLQRENDELKARLDNYENKRLSR